jgi:hypothetical protein
METIYKDKKIVFSENNEMWGLIEDGETVFENHSLAAVKLYIDKFEKEGFERYDCFATSWRGHGDFEIREAVVTSEPNSDEVWLKFKDGGDRHKERKRNVIEMTDKNRETIEKLKVLHLQKSAIEAEMMELKRTLTRLGDRKVET